MLSVKNNEFVIPGQLIGTKLKCDENCFYENGNVYSSVHGIVRIERDRVRVIPSSGSYIPKERDMVIGIVSDIHSRSWDININSAYPCRLRGEELTDDPLNDDLSKYFSIGDTISAKISRVDEVKNCTVEGPWKLDGGLVIEINPKRIPRVVGKKRSMLNLIKSKTGSKILVGQNGRVWIKGGNVTLAITAIKKIEREAQTKGLTDRIANMLNKEAKRRSDKMDERL